MEKKGFSEMLNEFFAGKGFYIVLLLCAALIGTSIWLMAGGSRADVETAGKEMDVRIADASGQSEAPNGAVAAMKEETQSTTPRRQGTGLLQPELTEIAPQAPRVNETPAEPRTETASAAEEYFIWPVNGRLERGYSVETLSYDPTMADWRLHRGWDIAAEPGELVLSTTAGTVSAVYTDEKLGTVVEVSHEGGLVSVYANLDSEPMVTQGQRVEVGSVLGRVGSTARSEVGEISHLHFAMRLNGQDADPADWLPQP
ncbi:MAG: M23 family metallopeptidase [Oscillospiraceae bacterium]|nr:M23 family metallopeptidase [Oscillospiraceae bacterium]